MRIVNLTGSLITLGGLPVQPHDEVTVENQFYAGQTKADVDSAWSQGLIDVYDLPTDLGIQSVTDVPGTVPILPWIPAAGPPGTVKLFALRDSVNSPEMWLRMEGTHAAAQTLPDDNEPDFTPVKIVAAQIGPDSNGIVVELLGGPPDQQLALHWNPDARRATIQLGTRHDAKAASVTITGGLFFTATTPGHAGNLIGVELAHPSGDNGAATARIEDDLNVVIEPRGSNQTPAEAELTALDSDADTVISAYGSPGASMNGSSFSIEPRQPVPANFGVVGMSVRANPDNFPGVLGNNVQVFIVENLVDLDPHQIQVDNDLTDPAHPIVTITYGPDASAQDVIDWFHDNPGDGFAAQVLADDGRVAMFDLGPSPFTGGDNVGPVQAGILVSAFTFTAGSDFPGDAGNGLTLTLQADPDLPPRGIAIDINGGLNIVVRYGRYATEQDLLDFAAANPDPANFVFAFEPLDGFGLTDNFGGPGYSIGALAGGANAKVTWTFHQNGGSTYGPHDAVSADPTRGVQALELAGAVSATSPVGGIIVLNPVTDSSGVYVEEDMKTVTLTDGTDEIIAGTVQELLDAVNLNPDTAALVIATPEEAGLETFPVASLVFEGQLLEGGEDAGADSTTVQELIEAVNNDPVLSQHIVVQPYTGTGGLNINGIPEDADTVVAVSDPVTLDGGSLDSYLAAFFRD